MIEPLQKDMDLLADIEEASGEGEGLHVWWLGQSGFLLMHEGTRVLFDPYLSDSLTRKYAGTDKPHVRISERCIDPEWLKRIDCITASHVHTDHLDGETLQALGGSNPGARLLLPGPIVEEAMRRLESAPLDVIELNQGDEATFDGMTWRGVAATHNEIVLDELGRAHCIGFILKIGNFTVYHSGDTLWHPGLVSRLLPEQCDLMLLPINGNKPERRVAGNLNGTEAAALAKACGAGMVVPCHYDLFEFNTESPEEFVTACDRLGQPHRVLGLGERMVLSPSKTD